MRRPPAAAAPSIPLFPFQAVLSATMGALILILIVVNRQGRLEAATLVSGDNPSAAPTADAPVVTTKTAAESTALNSADAADREEAARIEQEQIAWQIEQLQQSRQKTEADLADARLKLSGAEDHLRQLRDRWEALKNAAKAMAQESAGRRQAIEAERDKLAAELAAAEEAVKQARLRAQNRPQSYAIVPYEGPNKTQRRPIYIECLADRVVLQPENIVLRPKDFLGPNGPGNPLASALRAARETLSEIDRASIEKLGEPYPLLIVRPDGIVAYYAARGAMESWGSEFGYEFVSADWSLAYPPAHPQLAAAEQRAVDESRERLAAYAASVGAARGNGGGVGGERKPRPQYRVSQGTAGVVREGHDTPQLDQEVDSVWNDLSGTGKPRGGSGNGSGRSDRAGQGGNSGSGGTGSAENGSGVAGGAANRGVGGNGTTPGGSPPGHSHSAGGGSGTPPNGENPETGGITSAQVNGGRQSSAADAARPRMSVAEENAAAAARDAATGYNSSTPPRKLDSLASKRHQNWALGTETKGLNPVTRPIRIECRGDRLTILPEPGEAGGAVVWLPGRTEDAVDSLVTQVRRNMRSWGIAGNRMYWRPLLVLEIGLGGEGRFVELQSLLENSGFDVQRKK